jgi:hypothetical protein
MFLIKEQLRGKSYYWIKNPSKTSRITLVQDWGDWGGVGPGLGSPITVSNFFIRPDPECMPFFSVYIPKDIFHKLSFPDHSEYNYLHK